MDDLLDGTTPVDGIDIDGGSVDGTPIGAVTPSTGAFTTLTTSDAVTLTDTGTFLLDSGVGTISLGKSTAAAVSIDAGSKTDAFAIPVGDTSERPTPSEGMFRRNSETGFFEGYDGSGWINVNPDLASVANFRDNTADKVLETDTVWGAAAEVTLTDGANISLDLDSGINFTVTLAGNRTLDNPTNAKQGQSGYIRVVQDATGSRTLAFGANYVFSGGDAVELTTTAAAEDILFYQVLSSTKILVALVADIS
jgi:hypothetical protein